MTNPSIGTRYVLEVMGKYKAKSNQHIKNKSFRVTNRVCLQLNKDILCSPIKKIKTL